MRPTGLGTGGLVAILACSCGIACGPTDMPVTSCTQDVVQCGPGETRVDKCEPQ
jgi:hypothetical protein